MENSRTTRLAVGHHGIAYERYGKARNFMETPKGITKNTHDESDEESFRRIVAELFIRRREWTESHERVGRDTEQLSNELRHPDFETQWRRVRFRMSK